MSFITVAINIFLIALIIGSVSATVAKMYCARYFERMELTIINLRLDIIELRKNILKHDLKSATCGNQNKESL